MTTDMNGTEYRVTWRRHTWTARSSSKSRTFARWHDAARFITRLHRPDLSAVEVFIDRRTVGPWTPSWTEPCRTAAFIHSEMVETIEDTYFDSIETDGIDA